MTDVDLLTVSIVAFVAVFLLLGALAVLMQVLTMLFPAPTEDDEAALISAITTAAAAAYPDMRVTSIEERR
jgi:hypothetical protein